MKYRIAIVTGIKNDVELIEYFIEHHLNMGFAKIYLMDMNSTDGSREVLKQYQNNPQVVVKLTDYNIGSTCEHQMFRLQTYRDPDIDYIFYLDLDEFLVKDPKYTLEELLDEQPSKCYHINRYNIVIPQQFRQGLSSKILNNLHRFLYLTPYTRCNYPIQSPTLEWREWIMQPIPLKVMHKKEPVQVSFGGHFVYGDTIRQAVQPKGLFIAHIPVTTYARMCQKLIDRNNQYKTNPNWFKVFLVRYYHLCHAYQQGLAEPLYEKVFLEKELVHDMLKDATIQKASVLLNVATKQLVLKKPDIYNSYILSSRLATLPE